MDKLNKILMDVLRIEKKDIKDDFDIRNAKNWDSLKHMQFIFSIESAYGIELSQDEIVKMAQVSDIKAILSKQK